MGGAVPVDRLRPVDVRGTVWWNRLRAGLLCATAALLPLGYVLAAGIPLLLLWLAECAALRRPPWERTPVDGLLALWFGWVLISALTSPHRDLAVGNAILLLLGAMAGIAPLTRTLREQQAFRVPLYWAWVAGGAVAGVWVVVRLAESPPHGNLPQLGHNAAGTVLAAASVLGVALLSTGGRRALLVGLAAQVLVLAGLLATLSRGAWLGWTAGIFFLASLRTGRAWYVALGAVAAFTLALATHPALRGRALSAFELDPYRIRLWRTSVQMLVDHPWLGVGFGAFLREYPSYRPPEYFYDAAPFAHNLPLSLAVETGVPGALLFMGFLVYALWLSFRHAMRAPPPHKLLQGAGLAALVAVMTHQLVDGTIQSFHLGFAFWLLLASILPNPQ